MLSAVFRVWVLFYHTQKEKAYLSTINGIADGFLRGIGIGGAAVSTIKNVLIKISEDASDPVSDVLDFSESIFSLLRICCTVAGVTF